MISPFRIVLIAVLTLPWQGARRAAGREGPVIRLSRAARASMSAEFARSNQHWDELADLNTMERMLGTIRPTQREYLGCLQGEANGQVVRIDSWVPARDMKQRDMKQLQQAVAGSCDSVPRLVGTWHTHPFRADRARSHAAPGAGSGEIVPY